MSGKADDSRKPKQVGADMSFEEVVKKLGEQEEGFILLGASPGFLKQLEESGHNPSSLVVSGEILGRVIKKE